MSIYLLSILDSNLDVAEQDYYVANFMIVTGKLSLKYQYFYLCTSFIKTKSEWNWDVKVYREFVNIVYKILRVFV